MIWMVERILQLSTTGDISIPRILYDLKKLDCKKPEFGGGKIDSHSLLLWALLKNTIVDYGLCTYLFCVSTLCSFAEYHLCFFFVFFGGGPTGAILSEKKKGPIIAELPLEQIRRPLLRTRNNNPEKVQQLMDSIADIGLQEPVSLMDIHYSPNNFVRIFDWVAMVVYVLANWLSQWKYWRGGWEVKWTLRAITVQEIGS